MPSYPDKDCYETLGVDPSAPQEVIDAAWRALSKMFHPDLRAKADARSGRFASEERQKEINQAYDCLKNPQRRKEYDHWRRGRKWRASAKRAAPTSSPPSSRESDWRGDATPTPTVTQPRSSPPAATLASYRRFRFWPSVVAGASVGYFLHSVLPPGHSRNAIETAAGLLGVIMTTVSGARRAGWSGGLGGLLVTSAALPALQVASPAALSSLAWAAVYGALVSISAPWLFAAKRDGRRSAAISVVSCGALLAAAALGGGVLLEARRGNPNPAGASWPALQIGVVSTCGSVKGWQNYTPKVDFRPGDAVCLYAEAVGINRGSQIDVTSSAELAGPSGFAVSAQPMHFSKYTPDASFYYTGSLPLPPDSPPGSYAVRFSVRNNLSGQQAQAWVYFTVTTAAASPRGAAAILPASGVLPRATQTITTTPTNAASSNGLPTPVAPGGPPTPPSNPRSASAAAALRAARPGTVWLPSGTAIEVLTLDSITTDLNPTGGILRGWLAAPIVVAGRVAVPRGAPVYLRAVAIHPAKRPNSRGEVRLALDHLEYQGITWLLDSSTLDVTNLASKQIGVPPGTTLEFQLLVPATVAPAPKQGAR